MTRALRRRICKLAALSIIVALALAACGDGGRATVSAGKPNQGGPTPGTDVKDIDWENPFGSSGVKFGSTSAAGSKLAFSPKVPSAFGNAKSIFVSNPNDPERQGAFGLLYVHPTFGRFFLREQVSTTNQADLEAFLKYNDEPTSEAKFSLVPLGRGTNALFLDGPDVSSIEWLDSGLLFTVLGPTPTFNKSVATTVANSI